MSAVQRWKAKLQRRHESERQQRPAREAEERPHGFWDEKKSAWFNRFAADSDRSHTYQFVEPHVRGTVLEVGPGPGAYTRLLLRDAERVVAVERSPFMVEFLRQRIPDEAKLKIVTSSIEEYIPKLERFDLALAANVLGGLERIDEVVVALTDHADLLAIVMWANAQTPEWSVAVQTEVLGHYAPQPDMPNHDDLVAVLEELGLAYEEHSVDVPIHTFRNTVDLVDWVEGFHSVPEEQRAELEAVLGRFVSEQGGMYGLPSGRDTRVLLVRKAAG